MKNIFYAKVDSPKTGSNWIKTSELDRIKLITTELQKNDLYKNFEPIKAPDNGQIVIKIENSIPANVRGPLLLDLEQRLKLSIDKGITVWCEPIGDKSKLRNLRGVKIKA
tara:strand:- start:2546 stop:2875 length:330 start_codon:yes stop_codon:yes gene_type:complete